MKELSIEEKAKRYDEAIKKAESKIKNNKDHVLYEDDIIEIFPELMENGSEKIRKALLKFVHDTTGDDLWIYYDVHKEDALAWLEKQGEQKPTESQKDYYNIDPHFGKPIDFKAKDFYVSKVDGQIHDMTYSSANKVESKFKVGDWITFYGGNQFKILKVEQEQNGILNYLLLDQNDRDSYYNKKYVDENARLWTIQDVKDGDVLRLGSIIAIFKKYIGQEKCICYCSISEDEDFEIPIENGEDNVYGCIDAAPATKEQYDLLFQKMKEKNYEWNAKKKELIKVKQETAEWTEEDETNLHGIIAEIMANQNEAPSFDTKVYDGYLNWLVSIKRRMQ